MIEKTLYIQSVMLDVLSGSDCHDLNVAKIAARLDDNSYLDIFGILQAIEDVGLGNRQEMEAYLFADPAEP